MSIADLDLRRTPVRLDAKTHERARRITRLMEDGGSTRYRFMDAHQCALWMLQHSARLVEILAEHPDE